MRMGSPPYMKVFFVRTKPVHHNPSQTITEETLQPDEAKRFVDNLFRGDTLKAAGTGPDKIMPAISRFGGGETARKRNTVSFPADPVSLKNIPDCFRRHRAGEPRDCLKIQFSYRLREWEAI